MAVIPATVPIHVGLFEGDFVPNKVAIDAEKLGPLRNAIASSFNASGVVGADFTKVDTIVAVA